MWNDQKNLEQEAVASRRLGGSEVKGMGGKEESEQNGVWAFPTTPRTFTPSDTKKTRPHPGLLYNSPFHDFHDFHTHTHKPLLALSGQR